MESFDIAINNIRKGVHRLTEMHAQMYTRVEPGISRLIRDIQQKLEKESKRIERDFEPFKRDLDKLLLESKHLMGELPKLKSSFDQVNREINDIIYEIDQLKGKLDQFMMEIVKNRQILEELEKSHEEYKDIGCKCSIESHFSPESNHQQLIRKFQEEYKKFNQYNEESKEIWNRCDQLVKKFKELEIMCEKLLKIENSFKLTTKKYVTIIELHIKPTKKLDVINSTHIYDLESVLLLAIMLFLDMVNIKR
jgi:chromosome segregation ATPase